MLCGSQRTSALSTPQPQPHSPQNPPKSARANGWPRGRRYANMRAIAEWQRNPQPFPRNLWAGLWHLGHRHCACANAADKHCQMPWKSSLICHSMRPPRSAFPSAVAVAACNLQSCAEGGKLKTRLQPEPVNGRGNWIIMSPACGGPADSPNFVLGRVSHAAKTFPLPLAVSTATSCARIYFLSIFFGKAKVSHPPEALTFQGTGQNRKFATAVMQLSLAVEPAASSQHPAVAANKPETWTALWTALRMAL